MRLLAFFTVVLAVAGLTAPAPLAAQKLKTENLLVGLPSGYKIAFKTRKGNMLMTEMIPKAETLKNWSEMLTVQVFLNNRKLKPVKFYQVIRGLFAKNCKGNSAHLIKKGLENGYPFAFFYISCHLNPETGKAENIWFKTIRGKDSFYVIQKAWRKTPAKAGIIKWTKFLRNVAVCDTRRTISKCPRIRAPKKK